MFVSLWGLGAVFLAEETVDSTQQIFSEIEEDATQMETEVTTLRPLLKNRLCAAARSPHPTVAAWYARRLSSREISRRAAPRPTPYNQRDFVAGCVD